MAIDYGAKFPRYLSALPQILWWEMDEFAVIICFFTMWATIGGWQNAVCLFVVPYAYRKTKYRSENGYFKRILYMTGMGKLDGYPTHFQKKFQE